MGWPGSETGQPFDIITIMSKIAEHYLLVQERIAAAAQRAGRASEDITMIAVTKTWPVDVVLSAYEAGMRHFGENRAEELEAKRSAINAALGPDNDITWHHIGTLQSRKTNLAAENADIFHAMDRLKIAKRLSRRLEIIDRELPYFLEVNISEEASKSGFACGNWENSATEKEHLRNSVETINQLPGLHLQGLMTMAPWGVEEEIIRSVFRRTRQLAAWLQASFPQVSISKLSMGMSDDFEIGIEEGATHIRVGRALFGSRH